MLKLTNMQVEPNGVPVLKNISFEVAAGDSLVLAGPSGSGKSSLLKALLGGCKWRAESYIFNGVNVTPGLIQTVRQQSGYIGQEYNLEGITVYEALKRPFAFSIYRDREFSRQELMRLMGSFLLSADFLERGPTSLSGGQRQRFAIIRTLLLKPKLIVADEPTSALDQDCREAVIHELLDQGTTVVSTSHDSAWISRCSRVLSLNHGSLVFRGEADVRFG